MRKLLLLALLLYDIVALAIRSGNYDYDELDSLKRHVSVDDRRNWRKKALLKSMDLDHKDWELDRRRHEYDPRYFDELEARNYRDADYRRRYDDVDKSLPRPEPSLSVPKSAEHLQGLDNKEVKSLGPMNCERPHERYEPCFAGCASVTCDNPRDRLRPCYPFCEPGCVCIPPYVRDDRTHKCILPDDCTKGLKGIPDIGEEL